MEWIKNINRVLNRMIDEINAEEMPKKHQKWYPLYLAITILCLVIGGHTVFCIVAKPIDYLGSANLFRAHSLVE